MPVPPFKYLILTDMSMLDIPILLDTVEPVALPNSFPSDANTILLIQNNSGAITDASQTIQYSSWQCNSRSYYIRHFWFCYFDGMEININR